MESGKVRAESDLSNTQGRKRVILDSTDTVTGTVTDTVTVTMDQKRPYIVPAYSRGSSLEQSSFAGRGNLQPPLAGRFKLNTGLSRPPMRRQRQSKKRKRGHSARLCPRYAALQTQRTVNGKNIVETMKENRSPEGRHSELVQMAPPVANGEK